MRIVVNTRFLQKNKLEGYGYYIQELFKIITVNNLNHQFLFVFDRPFDISFNFTNNIQAKVIGPPARHAFSFKFWYDVQLTIAAKKFKADVIVSLDGFCSLTSSIPQLLAVHDLAFKHYPQFIPKHHLWYYQLYQKKFLQKAKTVVTVSVFSKQDIINYYPIDSQKIHIVPNAAKTCFKPIDTQKKESIKTKYATSCEYFLFVGSIHPRKNLMQLLKAFSIFKKRQLSSMKLLVVGQLAWQHQALMQKLATYKYRDDVILLNYVDEQELANITASAYALMYTSLFEGFGVPIIEAMQCGVPVACSNTSSMPEVAGDAALLFDPNNEIEIAEIMMLIYKDEVLRSNLIKKGFIQAAQFSWETSAKILWQLIKQTAN